MNIIDNELNTVNKTILEILTQSHNCITDDICNFIFSTSKKIRPKIILLTAKALNNNISEEIIYLACAVELIHSATLIHDDIIDNAEMRRGKISLNYKFGNNLSVLSGDLLLSIAVQCLVKCNNPKIFGIFAESLKLMCSGEINQHFCLNKVPSMEEYITKSENKTAELFKSSLVSLCHICDFKQTAQILEFAKNFGIAFQLRDDYLNIFSADKSKPILSDIKNGIFTAPVIYLSEVTNISNLSYDEIITLIKGNDTIKDKTINLIKKYAIKAIASIEFIEDNQYKKELITLSENLYKAV